MCFLQFHENSSKVLTTVGVKNEGTVTISSDRHALQ